MTCLRMAAVGSSCAAWCRASGFESGDRFVIGHWLSSPIGAFTDLMWAAPDGTRHLRVPSARALAFVSGIYAFDHASVAPVVATVTTSSVEVDAGDVGVDLHGGSRPIPFSSIPGVTRGAEIAR